jgi:hypothetical protein
MTSAKSSRVCQWKFLSVPNSPPVWLHGRRNNRLCASLRLLMINSNTPRSELRRGLGIESSELSMLIAEASDGNGWRSSMLNNHAARRD